MIEADVRLWTSNASPVTRLFQNEVMFLLKIMLISDEPLLTGQPPLSCHLLVPQGWPLKKGSTLLSSSLLRMKPCVMLIVARGNPWPLAPGPF